MDRADGGRVEDRAMSKIALDDRIAAAFEEGPTSKEVEALIAEVEAAVVSSSEVAERARKRALDPTLSGKDIVSARREMEDAAFARDRVSAAVPRLQWRHEALLEAEIPIWPPHHIGGLFFTAVARQ
jgi:hypothetical protein